MFDWIAAYYEFFITEFPRFVETIWEMGQGHTVLQLLAAVSIVLWGLLTVMMLLVPPAILLSLLAGIHDAWKGQGRNSRQRV